MTRSPRKKLRFGSAAALLALAARLGANGEVPPDRMFSTVRVADGVYAFVAAETNGPIPSGNVTAILGDDGALVVDSGRFPSLARRMIGEIRRRTDRPVRFLVHTHWHLDHVAADAEFRKAFPSLTFLATDFTRRKMLEKQVAYLRDIQKNNAGYVRDLEAYVAAGKRADGTPLSDSDRSYLRREIADIEMETSELAGVPLVEPDVTFSRETTVHLGKREVRIAFLGAGNTAGDAVTFVPDAKVAIAGDLLVSPVPYGYGCSPREWIETLRRLMGSGATAIVPGHGPVLHDWKYAEKVLRLLEAVRVRVGEAAAAGASPEETRKRVDLTDFEKEFAGDDPDRRKAFRGFFAAPAVERAYQEAKGALAEE